MATDLREVLNIIQAFVNYGRAEESDLKGLWNDLSLAIRDNDAEIERLQKEYINSSEKIGRMDKEIERLKGLIKDAFCFGDTTEKEWQDFQLKNNL